MKSRDTRIARTVLFGDCDPAGIAYTPRLCHYAIEAAAQFVSERLGEPMERAAFALGVSIPVIALDMDFRRALTWDDRIELCVTLAGLRSRSYTLLVEVFTAAGAIAFRARVTQTCVSAATRRAVNLPPTWRAALSGN